MKGGKDDAAGELSARELLALRVDDITVARYVEPVGLATHLCPRPHLHPVTTLAGTVVTDVLPEDHPWHLGVSVAIQHVGDANFWGGRTYVRDEGYVWRHDHGVVRHERWVSGADGRASAEHIWEGPDGRAQLREQRGLSWARVPDAPCWQLVLSSALRNVSGAALELGSPGSHGRSGGGYGGFFWRLPPAPDGLEVATAEGQGEEAVHGVAAPWLLVRGEHDGGRYSLVFAGWDERTARDPWFVRVAGYPGVGSALAYERALRLEPDAVVSRQVSVLLVDGHAASEEIDALLHETPIAYDDTGG